MTRRARTLRRIVRAETRRHAAVPHRHTLQPGLREAAAILARGRGSRARYRRAVEAQVEVWDAVARLIEKSAVWAGEDLARSLARANRYASAARRARRILEGWLRGA